MTFLHFRKTYDIAFYLHEFLTWVVCVSDLEIPETLVQFNIRKQGIDSIWLVMPIWTEFQLNRTKVACALGLTYENQNSHVPQNVELEIYLVDIKCRIGPQSMVIFLLTCKQAIDQTKCARAKTG